MSTDFESEVDELLRQSYRQGAGPAKIALVEGAVRLADAHQRTDLGFATRKELIRAATLCGSPEKAMVAFTWCLGWCDREPERFSEDDILWQYKWIMGNVSEFPQVTREQIDGMAEDMTLRYQRCGRGMRAVHKLRCLIAMDMERHDDARTFQRLWRFSQMVQDLCRDFDRDGVSWSGEGLKNLTESLGQLSKRLRMKT